MNFTFGIITDGNNDNRLNLILDSIESQNIKNYQIIIVGNSKIFRKNTITIPFEENLKQRWITRKKNIITENAAYENIVYLHDYIYFLDGWYTGQVQAGEQFYVRMNRILNYDGSRFRDWCLWPHNDDVTDDIIKRNCILSYDIVNLSKLMYISGSYWIAKKYIMEEFPLDESLSWGESEDVEWSKRVRKKYQFSLNTASKVKLMKQKDKVFLECDDYTLQKIQECFSLENIK